MTCSKRKLITPERKPPSNIQEVVVGKRFNINNNSKTATALFNIPHVSVSIARVNTNTHTLFSYCPPTAEGDLKGMLPSSSTQSSQPQSRSTCLNAHYKLCRSAPQNLSQQRPSQHTETATALRTQIEKPRFHHKKIFQHSTY